MSALTDKMIEVAEALDDVGYEILAEQIRYAAENMEESK